MESPPPSAHGDIGAQLETSRVDLAPAMGSPVARPAQPEAGMHDSLAAEADEAMTSADSDLYGALFPEPASAAEPDPGMSLPLRQQRGRGSSSLSASKRVRSPSAWSLPIRRRWRPTSGSSSGSMYGRSSRGHGASGGPSYLDPDEPAPDLSFYYNSDLRGGRPDTTAASITFLEDDTAVFKKAGGSGGNAKPPPTDGDPYDYDDSRIRRFGTWDGVLVISLLNIFDLLLFVRLPFVLANAGLMQSYFILLLSFSLLTITTMSMSAIVTNGRVSGGGLYFLVSRSLGPEIGTAIGVLYFIGQTLGVALQLVGLAEALASKLRFSVVEGGWSISLSLVSYSWDVRLYAIVLLLLTLAVCMKGLGHVVRLQTVFLGVLIVSLLSIMIGSMYRTNEAQAVYGPSSDRISANVDSAYRKGQDFASLLGIFFPAVTGRIAAASISGELINPRKNVPMGTFVAVGIGFVVHTVLLLIISSTLGRYPFDMTEAAFTAACTRNTTAVPLASLPPLCLAGSYRNNFILDHVSVWGPLAFIGVAVTTVSSALGAMVGAPRTIGRLAKDKIVVNRLFTALARYRPDGEPQSGYLLTSVLAFGAVMIGDLNDIAPLITMFYLLVYGLINLAAFAATRAKTPGWRPSFRFFNSWIALFGVCGCVGVMFYVNWAYALVAVGMAIAVMAWVKYKDPLVSWGPAGHAYKIGRLMKQLLGLRTIPWHAKTWRPNVLILQGWDHLGMPDPDVAPVISIEPACDDDTGVAVTGNGKAEADGDGNDDDDGIEMDVVRSDSGKGADVVDDVSACGGGEGSGRSSNAVQGVDTDAEQVSSAGGKGDTVDDGVSVVSVADDIISDMDLAVLFDTVPRDQVGSKHGVPREPSEASEATQEGEVGQRRGSGGTILSAVSALPRPSEGNVGRDDEESIRMSTPTHMSVEAVASSRAKRIPSALKVGGGKSSPGSKPANRVTFATPDAPGTWRRESRERNPRRVVSEPLVAAKDSSPAVRWPGRMQKHTSTEGMVASPQELRSSGGVGAARPQDAGLGRTSNVGILEPFVEEDEDSDSDASTEEGTGSVPTVIPLEVLAVLGGDLAQVRTETLPRLPVSPEASAQASLLPKRKRSHSDVGMICLCADTNEGNNGMTVFGRVLVGDYRSNLKAYKRAYGNGYAVVKVPRIHRSRRRIIGLTNAVIASSFSEGARALWLAAGAGKLRPNVVMVPFCELYAVASDSFIREYVTTIRDALATGLNVAIVRHAALLVSLNATGPIPEGHRIDVWWLVDDGGFGVLLPHLLSRSSTWSACTVRILGVPHDPHDPRGVAHTLAVMQKMVYEFRLNAEVEVVLPTAASQDAWERVFPDAGEAPQDAGLQGRRLRMVETAEVIWEQSSDASLVFVTLPYPRDHVDDLEWLRWVDVLSRLDAPVVMTRGNQVNILTLCA